MCYLKGRRTSGVLGAVGYYGVALTSAPPIEEADALLWFQK
jgi:hypothetical protein